MNDNVIKFFERYNADESLRLKVKEAQASYPGSLEIKDAVAEATLLPVAAELGLPFELKDLRAYETRLKVRRVKPDVAIPEGEPIEDGEDYFLLDSGWSNDPDIFKIDKDE